MPELMTDAKRRLMDTLKRIGPTTATELARIHEMTDVAIRQHLLILQEQGWVETRKQPADGRGRPALLWTLTDASDRLYPDRHGELAVGLITAMRHAFGVKGVQRIVDARATEQVAAYRRLMPQRSASLREHADALARQRTAEGYMAEVVEDETGTLLLIEHHCPICEAATCCTGLCGAELDVFRRVLGDDVTVERTVHLLSGGDRCVYRITPAGQATIET